MNDTTAKQPEEGLKPIIRDLTANPTLIDQRMSTNIGEIGAALAKAQGAMRHAKRDKTLEHSHYIHKYADLASVWDSIRKPLSDNNISVVQQVGTKMADVSVTTMLIHSSGEWIRSNLTMTPAARTPQGIGVCITYARRYALSSMVGAVSDDDTDGNTNVGAEPPNPNSMRGRDIPEDVADELETGYQQQMALDEEDLTPRRMKILNGLVGKGKHFGTKAAEAKKWVKSVSGGTDVTELDAEQCAKVEEALKGLGAKK